MHGVAHLLEFANWDRRRHRRLGTDVERPKVSMNKAKRSPAATDWLEPSRRSQLGCNYKSAKNAVAYSSRRNMPTGDYTFVRFRLSKRFEPPSAQAFGLSFFPLLRKGQIWRSLSISARSRQNACLPGSTERTTSSKQHHRSRMW